MTSLSLWLAGVGCRLAITVISTATIIILARVLGPESMGQYFVFVTLVTVLSVAADCGMSHSAAVFAGRQTDPLWRVHGVLVRFVPFLALAVATPAAAVLWLAGSWLLPGFPHRWMALALLIIPLVVYASFWNNLMIGMRQVVRVHLTQLVIRGLALVLNLMFVAISPGGINAAIAVYAVVVLAQAVTMFLMAWRTLPRTADTPAAPGLARSMFHFGLRGYFGLLSDLLWARSTVFLLNGFHGSAAVAVFSVAQQFAERVLLPTEVMQNVIYRRVSSLPREDATSAMNRYLRVTIWAMLPILLLVALIAPWAVPLLLGSAYRESAAIIPLLLCGSLVMIPVVLLATFFMGQLRRPGLVSILGWLHLVTNVLLGLVLIPPWVETGAALGLVGSQVLGAMVIVAMYLRLAPAPLAAVACLQPEDVALAVKQARQLLWRPGTAP